MERKICKQIYLTIQQNDLLKRLAEQWSMTESEVVCQLLEKEFAREKSIYPYISNRWGEIFALIAERNAKYAGQGEPATWNRDELYERGKTLR